MLAGSATVFFAYIGFDAVASTAEEVKNPQRDLPLGIVTSLSICCGLYMLVSVVIVGLVPYYAMNPDTPLSSAFASHGMQWASYIVTAGAVTALCSTLMGSLLPQPRILMSMARDGLLPPFFSDINKQTQVPLKSTITTGICAATLGFFMDVSQLAGMVSVGTLLAFTMVAISILILRYVTPDEVPLPSSLHESIVSFSFDSGKITKDLSVENPMISMDSQADSTKPLLDISDKNNRRKIAGWTIMSTCVGAFLLTYPASSLGLPSFVRYSVCGVGGFILLSALIVLTYIEQDDARHNFGYTGGFICPFVPLLPILCILINVYLMINIGQVFWLVFIFSYPTFFTREIT